MTEQEIHRYNAVYNILFCRPGAVLKYPPSMFSEKENPKMNMQKLANTFQAAHRNGTVSHVTDYSFKFTIQPKKDTDKPKEVIYYESYFLEL